MVYLANMKTTKTKKVVNKEAEEKVEKKETKVNNGAYHVFLDLNDKTYEVDTDDIKATILSFKPSLLKTSLTVKVTKGNKMVVRYLYLNDARRLFSNDITLGVFVRNILMNYPNGR